jgi:hypothetical protein
VSILASTLVRRLAGGLVARTATAGILRLALRWPALAVILVLTGLIARVMTGRRRRAGDGHPASPAR